MGFRGTSQSTHATDLGTAATAATYATLNDPGLVWLAPLQSRGECELESILFHITQEHRYKHTPRFEIFAVTCTETLCWADESIAPSTTLSR